MVSSSLKRKLYRISLLGAFVLLIVPLDQWTKFMIVNHMELGESITILPHFFNIVHVRNYGTAFGLFSELPTVLRQLVVLLLPVAVLIVLILLFFWKEFYTSIGTITIGLVIAGAIGNLLDRFFQGYVVDFLDLNLGFMHWPAFNVADTCVTTGGFGLMVYYTFFYKKKQTSSDADD